MPTNEERQEIAENLRIMTSYGCKYAEQFYDLLKETVMDSWDFHEFGDVADRLADLIEPEPVCIANVTITAEQIEEIKADVLKELEQPERTCKVEQDYDMMEDGIPDCRIWRCSCGEAFPYWRGCKPIFCPNCGAKAVEE